MSEEEILEQPQSASHPSDFNDLHVLLGIEAVREQIESGIDSQYSAFGVPPHPLEMAGQGLGQFSAADQAFLDDIDPSKVELGNFSSINFISFS